MKNILVNLIVCILLIGLSSFAAFRWTTYFHVDAGYAGVLANQQNYNLIKDKLEDDKEKEAIDYIDLLISANNEILEAALLEDNMSNHSRQRITKYLE